MHASNNSLVVDIRLLDEFPLLEEEWKKLEQQSDASFFTTWHWIGPWLAISRDVLKIHVLSVSRGGELVALGLLTEEKIVRRKYFSCRSMILNSSTKYPLNMIIEHNKLLIKKGQEDAVFESMVAFLDGKFQHIDEFVIPFMDQGTYNPTTCKQAGRFNVKSIDVLPSPYVDLERVRSCDNSFLNMLSRNTRYQIRKSIGLYEQFGKIVVEEAANASEALSFFLELKKFHQAYWNQKGEPGSFSNSEWEQFHQSIIREMFEADKVQLLRFKAGKHYIGYIYSLVWNGQVNMIQTGFNYELSPKAKPGYICHYLAIEHNITKGMEVYDFLAGDSQYKQSLSNTQAFQENFVLQRKKIKFYVEDLLTKLYRLVKSA